MRPRPHAPTLRPRTSAGRFVSARTARTAGCVLKRRRFGADDYPGRLSFKISAAAIAPAAKERNGKRRELRACKRVFLRPASPKQRQYEALRA